MLFWCHKKIFHCNLFLFWMNSFKNSSEIFWVQCFWQLFTERWEFELSQSVHSFLKQHFARSCIYYSVIPTKIFSSVLAQKFSSRIIPESWVCINKVQKNLWTAQFFPKNTESTTIGIKLTLAKCERNLLLWFICSKIWLISAIETRAVLGVELRSPF